MLYSDNMEIDYIILRKKTNDDMSNINSSFRVMLKEIYEDVDDSHIYHTVNDKRECISYQISNSSSDMIFFKVLFLGSKMYSAKILDSFSKMLINGKHRKEYNNIISYDEPSHVHCCKAMPLFGIFERRLRELVYITVVKAFGVDWFQKTFRGQFEKTPEMHAMSEEKLIEGALNELTFHQMTAYLFAPFVAEKPEIRVEKILAEKETLTKEEIISLLEEIKYVSLWDRLFSEYPEFEDFSIQLDSLRRYRNRVMHNKRVTASDLAEIKKELRNANKKLENAIKTLDKKTYDDSTIQSMVNSYTAVINISEYLEKQSEKLASALSPAIANLKSSITIPALNSQEIMDFFPAINNMQEALRALGIMAMQEKIDTPLISAMRGFQKRQESFRKTINENNEFMQAARLGSLLASAYTERIPKEQTTIGILDNQSILPTGILQGGAIKTNLVSQPTTEDNHKERE